MNNVDILFGAFAPKLSKQLFSQGLSLSKKDEVMFQKDVDAITRLSIRGLLSNSIVHSMRQRLLKKIAKVVLTA